MRTKIGIHFEKGDRVRLKTDQLKHNHLKEDLGLSIHEVISTKWTDNLDYVDQFVQLDAGTYYNTIFEKI